MRPETLRVLGKASVTNEPVLREPLADASVVTFAREGPTGDQIFVATMNSGAICVVDQEPPSGSGVPPTNAYGLIAVGCGAPPEADGVGIGLANPAVGQVPAKITLLLPNDVQSVAFQSTTGAVTTESVEGNVAQYVANDLASATYSTDGHDVVVQVPSPPA